MESPTDFSVKFGREIMPVSLSLDRPLAALKDQLARMTRVPPERQKLMCSGVVMKDDGASLRRYGVKSRTQVLMLESGPPSPAKPTPAPVPPSEHHFDPSQKSHQGHQKHGHGPAHHHHLSPQEQDAIARLDAAVAQAVTVCQPQLERFSAMIEDYAKDSTAPPPPNLGLPPNKTMKSYLQDEYRRVTEGLMKQLLSIDNVQVDESHVEARAKRRQAVKIVQGFLDQADAIKAKSSL